MSLRAPDMAVRLAMRKRSPDPPVMYQSWGTLLFMHWQIPVEPLRRMIPGQLSIDTFEDKAWIGLTPFTVWGARPAFLPPLPWLNRFHEINVRTYVHLAGVPGVWFFSLDAGSLAAVIGARALFHLPYHQARMQLARQGGTVTYRASRKSVKHPASFSATWTLGSNLPPAEPGSLEFFLVERYCLYTRKGNGICRCRIFHDPWPLQKVTYAACESTMIEAAGLPAPHGEPLLLGGGPVHVAVWRLEEL